jgi:hypothetical protein
MRRRICEHRQTTLAGLAALAFAALLLWRNPALAEQPELLLLAAAGMAGLFSRDPGRRNG